MSIFRCCKCRKVNCPWAVTLDNLLLPLGEQLSLSLDIKIKCHTCLMCRAYFMSTSCFLKQQMIFNPWTLRLYTLSWKGFVAERVNYVIQLSPFAIYWFWILKNTSQVAINVVLFTICKNHWKVVANNLFSIKFNSCTFQYSTCQLNWITFPLQEVT